MSGQGSVAEHVIIIGAGLASLALAQALEKHSISFTVFERDSDASYRPQGYRIKTFERTDGDLKYLLRPHIFDEFQKTCAETVLGESTCNAINGQITASRRGWKPRPWTVDREVLRNVLMLDLKDKVQFGREFVRYETDTSTERGSITAHFADGTSATGTLLIGGDGARSRVCAQYLPTHHNAIDTQGVCVYGKTPFSAELEQSFPSHALRWITTYRDEAPLLTQITTTNNDVVTLFVDPMRWPARDTLDARVPLPEDYVYWALLLRRRAVPGGGPVQITDKPVTLLGEPAKELSLDITSEWDPAVRSILQLQETGKTAVFPIFCTDPNLAPWEPSAQVTLLGDAIHGMPPSGALGAVTALHDAAVLARQLIEHGMGRESIGGYEATMREYATAGIRRSLRAGKLLWNQPPFEECLSG